MLLMTELRVLYNSQVFDSRFESDGMILNFNANAISLMVLVDEDVYLLFSSQEA